jgi:hypothetical protein
VNAAVQRLRAEIASDRRAFRERVEELRSIDPSLVTPAACAQVAVALHHGYSAIEAVLERSARTIEGSLPTGPDWHVALLEATVLEVPEVRPALISRDSFHLLRRLLAFRHFFRHAYAISWDTEKLRGSRQDMLALLPGLEADLDRWDAHLAATAAEPLSRG